MTLLWLEGFEGYADFADMSVLTSDIVTVPYNCSNFAYNVPGAYGRNSTRGLRSIGSDRPWYFSISDSQSPSELVFGIAIYKEGINTPTASITYPFLSFRDSAAGGNKHIQVCLNADHNFEVYRNATLLGTSSGKTVVYQTYHYFEIKFKISDTVGYVQMWLDGVQILNLAATQDTLEGSNAYVRQFSVGPFHSNIATRFDDMYILDTGGSAPHNDRLGDVRVDPIRATGAGSNTDFSPSAGSNYENVDESPGPDDDTTYNDGDALNEKDSYQMGDLEALGTTIFALKHQMTVKKTDAGVVKVKPVVRSNSIDYVGDEKTLTAGYTIEAHIWTDNPDDSAAWEEADINGCELGAQITSIP